MQSYSFSLLINPAPQPLPWSRFLISLACKCQLSCLPMHVLCFPQSPAKTPAISLAVWALRMFLFDIWNARLPLFLSFFPSSLHLFFFVLTSFLLTHLVIHRIYSSVFYYVLGIMNNVQNTSGKIQIILFPRYLIYKLVEEVSFFIKSWWS